VRIGSLCVCLGANLLVVAAAAYFAYRVHWYPKDTDSIAIFLPLLIVVSLGTDLMGIAVGALLKCCAAGSKLDATTILLCSICALVKLPFVLMAIG